MFVNCDETPFCLTHNPIALGRIGDHSLDKNVPRGNVFVLDVGYRTVDHANGSIAAGVFGAISFRHFPYGDTEDLASMLRNEKRVARDNLS